MSDEKSVGEAVTKLIAVNQVKDGRARVTMLARGGGGFWKTKLLSARKTDLLIMTGDPHRVPTTGLSLAVSPYRVSTFSPLTGIKSSELSGPHIVAGRSTQPRLR
jgi:hypothetical protein